MGYIKKMGRFTCLVWQIFIKHLTKSGMLTLLRVGVVGFLMMKAGFVTKMEGNCCFYCEERRRRNGKVVVGYNTFKVMYEISDKKMKIEYFHQYLCQNIMTCHIFYRIADNFLFLFLFPWQFRLELLIAQISLLTQSVIFDRNYSSLFLVDISLLFSNSHW